MGALRDSNGLIICETTRTIASFADGRSRSIWKAGQDITCGGCGATIKQDALLTVNGNVTSRKNPIKLLCRTCRPFRVTGTSQL